MNMATTNKKAAPAKAAAPRARLAPDAVIPPTDVIGPSVKVNVPKPFTLTRDDSTQVSYVIGKQMMPQQDAEHQYAKDNGVTIL